MHSFVERELIARIGDAGRRLHTGRSRNEQVSLDFRLYLRRRIRVVQHALATLVDALAHQAETAGAGGDAVVHAPAARPAGARRARVAVARRRVPARRRSVRRRRARSRRHAARLRRDRRHRLRRSTSQLLAERLGFSRVRRNSIDASGDRDFVATFLYACSMAMVHLSRLAEDVILFSSEEFGFFEIHDSVATGSSLMPQKKNPDPLELVRGKSGKAIGLLTGWLTSMKGPAARLQQGSAGRQSDRLRSRRPVIACARTTATVVRTLTLRPDVARAAASGLAARHRSRRLPRRRAACRSAPRTKSPAASSATSTRSAATSRRSRWTTGADMTSSSTRACSRPITPEAAVAAEKTPQSTNPEAVAAALAETNEWLKARL